MNYNIFREFADSWFLLFMFTFFIAAVLWAFRPGSRRLHDDAGQVPFRHENHPSADGSEAGPMAAEEKPS